MPALLYKFGVTAISAFFGASIAAYALEKSNNGLACYAETKIPQPGFELPLRATQISALENSEYDVLVIGGGATGVGCALDAVTRGLKTALVEADDFASGTSSRSTKLLHGGVRYLQAAIMNFDKEQYKIVKEALAERTTLIANAPNLAHALPIMLPIYRWWQIPFYYFGIKCYDLVASDRNLKSSYFLTKKSALELFPMLKKERLCGALVYYDGQHDDARMCLAIALTAIRHGATICNHAEVIALKKSNDCKKTICGTRIRDNLTGKEIFIKSKCIINATGAFTDTIRKMDDPNVPAICSPSSGVHITLPGYYSPKQMGLLDPQTSDGRVIFFLPWQNHTIAGTTDLPCEVTHHPQPTESEILFIMNEIRNYLNNDVAVRRGDVLSAWCGIRPLVSDPNKADTKSLARNHIIQISPSNLVTIAGGKWTTYRVMAEETVNAAIKACKLEPQKAKSITAKLKLEGAHGWSPTMYIRLVQDFGMECETAIYLANCYGDRAFEVCELAATTGKRWPVIGNKIHPDFPYIDAEIKYGVREYACTAVDMIARRLRLAFLNVQAAEEALPNIVDIMANELNWSDAEKEKQIKAATEFLSHEMAHTAQHATEEPMHTKLSKKEIETYKQRFRHIDKNNRGYVSTNDLRKSFRAFGDANLTNEELHELLTAIDTSVNGQVDLQEYLQLIYVMKAGNNEVSRKRNVKKNTQNTEQLKRKIDIVHSGGGL